jgi:hypothetical protein
MATIEKQRKFTVILDEDVFETLRLLAFRKKNRVSEVIREAIALHPDVMQVASELGVDLDTHVVVPMGSGKYVRGKIDDENES